jgi:thiol-disulfide isomerase/thioredoxin
MIRKTSLLLFTLLALGACASAPDEDVAQTGDAPAVEELAESDAETLAEADAADMDADADQASGDMGMEENADGEMGDMDGDDAMDSTYDAEADQIFSNMKGKSLPNINRGVIEASDPAMVSLGQGQPQFLDFFGWWCGTCNALAPAIAATKAEYGETVEYLHLDVDDPANAALIEQFAVAGTPTFILLDGNGEIVQRWQGATDVTEIQTAMAALAPVAP